MLALTHTSEKQSPGPNPCSTSSSCLLLTSFGSKEFCRTCKKASSLKAQTHYVSIVSKKKYFESLEYYCQYYRQNGILNFNLQYIGNEDLISRITLTQVPLLFPPLKTHLTSHSF